MDLTLNQDIQSLIKKECAELVLKCIAYEKEINILKNRNKAVNLSVDSNKAAQTICDLLYQQQQLQKYLQQSSDTNKQLQQQIFIVPSDQRQPERISLYITLFKLIQENLILLQQQKEQTCEANNQIKSSSKVTSLVLNPALRYSQINQKEIQQIDQQYSQNSNIYQQCQNQDLRDQNSLLKDEINLLLKQQNDLTRQLGYYQKQPHYLQSHSQSIVQCDRCSDQQRNFDSQVNTFKQQLQNSEELNKQLLQQIAELKQVQKDLTKDADNCKLLSSNIIKLERTNKELTRKCAMLQEEQLGLIDSNFQAISSQNAIKHNLKEWQLQFKDTQIDQLNKMVANLCSICNIQNSDKLCAHLQIVLNDNKTMQSKIEKLEQKVRNSSNVNDFETVYNQNLTQLRNQLTAEQERNAVLQVHYNQNETQVSEQKQTITEQEWQIQQLQQQCSAKIQADLQDKQKTISGQDTLMAQYQKEITELKSQIQLVLGQNNQYLQTIQDMKFEIEELTKDKNDCTTMLRDLQMQLETYKQVAELRSQSLKCSKCEQLERQNSQTNAELSMLRQNFTSKEKELTTLQQYHSIVGKLTQVIKKCPEELVTAVQQMNEQLNGLRSQGLAWQEDQQQAQKYQTLKSLHDELTLKFNDQQSKFDQLQHSIRNKILTDEKYQQLKSEFDRQSLQFEQQQQEISQLQQTITTSDAKVSKQDQRIATLSVQNYQNQQELHMTQQDITLLKQVNQELSVRNQNLESLLKDKQIAFDDRCRQVDIYQNKVKDLTIKLTSIQSNIQQLEHDATLVSQMKLSNEKLQQQIHYLEQQIGQLSKEKNSWETEMKNTNSLLQETTKLKSQISQLQSDKQMNDNIVKQFKLDLERIQQKYEADKVQFQQIRLDNANQNQQIKELEDKLVQAQLIENELIVLKKEFNAVQQQNQQLKEQLNLMQSKLDDLNDEISESTVIQNEQVNLLKSFINQNKVSSSEVGNQFPSFSVAKSLIDALSRDMKRSSKQLFPLTSKVQRFIEGLFQAKPALDLIIQVFENHFLAKKPKKNLEFALDSKQIDQSDFIRASTVYLVSNWTRKAETKLLSVLRAKCQSIQYELSRISELVQYRGNITSTLFESEEATNTGDKFFQLCVLMRIMGYYYCNGTDLEKAIDQDGKIDLSNPCVQDMFFGLNGSKVNYTSMLPFVAVDGSVVKIPVLVE